MFANINYNRRITFRKIFLYTYLHSYCRIQKKIAFNIKCLID